MVERSRLQRMLRPKTAVFIGGSHLTPAIDSTRNKGFVGQLYMVHPYHGQVAGVACVRHVADLPAVPDLAFISVPQEAVIETIAACAAYGIAGAVCNTAGFSELKTEGIERQAQLVVAAGDMPILGPNCPGFANFLDNAVFMQDHFGDYIGLQKGVAVISNGGAYLSDVGCADRSLPIAYMFGAGNQAVLSIADLLNAVLDDERVTGVNLYVEGIRDVAKLSQAAWRAAQAGIPIVVTKGGRSQTGGRAAETHTASIAGDRAVASALFQRLGFIEVNTPMQAVETLKMFTCTRRPTGNRTAFLTSSGSYGVLGGDAAEEAGLAVLRLSAENAAAIRPRLPHFILPNNPLDISEAQFEADDVHEEIFDTFFSGNKYDLALLMMSFPPVGGWAPESWYRIAANFAKVAARHDLPCAFVNTVAEDLPADARSQMIADGMAPLMGMEQGMRAVGHAVQAGKMRARLLEGGETAVLLPDVLPQIGKPYTLDEASAKALLARQSVAVPNGRLATTAAACADLNFPVALKAVAPNLLHKTEIGAVHLNIGSVDALHVAMTNMRDTLRQTRPDLPTDQFLVEEMVTDGVAELLIGIRSISDIGYVLTLAIGGVAVELLQDAATLILPASRAAIETALRQLKLFALLDGWRGRPKADLDAAFETIEALCAYVLTQTEQLNMLEINPLIVCQSGTFAVDAVLQTMEMNE